MFDDAIDPNDPGVLELVRRLEAYADARLSPSMTGTTRMRASVMSAAHRRAALVAADGSFGAAGTTTAALAADRAPAAANAWRRPLVAVLAGGLTLALLVGTAFGARPGGPLYAARLWTEMANLPADVVARAEAEIDRLEARIQEAQQASTAGDGPATRAALSAYSVIVIEAARDSGGDPTASAAIEVTVTRHVVVLTLMVDSVPPPARDAVQEALSSSAMVLDDLDGAGKQESRDRRIDAGQSNASRPVGAGRERQNRGNEPAAAGGAAADEETIEPAKHAKPDKTAKDDKAGNPRSTGRGAGNGAAGGAGHDDPPGQRKGHPHDPDCDPTDKPDTGAT